MLPSVPALSRNSGRPISQGVPRCVRHLIAARSALGGAMLMSVLSTAAAAADFDGSKALLCAPTTAITCSANAECTRGGADTVNLPAFVRVDFKGKSISNLSGDRSTEILNMTPFEDQLILQGMQNGRGWTASIAKSTGEMTLSVAAGPNGHIVFGACTPQ